MVADGGQTKMSCGEETVNLKSTWGNFCSKEIQPRSRSLEIHIRASTTSSVCLREAWDSNLSGKEQPQRGPSQLKSKMLACIPKTFSEHFTLHAILRLIKSCCHVRSFQADLHVLQCLPNSVAVIVPTIRNLQEHNKKRSLTLSSLIHASHRHVALL